MNTPREQQLNAISMTISALFWLGHKTSVSSLAELGLTVPQAGVLMGLEAENGRASMSELARMGQLAPATMTGIIDRLIAAEWVVRERDAADRRVVWVQLTAAGYAKTREMAAQRTRDIRQLTADFSDTEVAQFHALIQRLLAAMTRDQPLPEGLFDRSILE